MELEKVVLNKYIQFFDELVTTMIEILRLAKTMIDEV